MKKNLIAKLLVSILLFSWCAFDVTGAWFNTREKTEGNIFTAGWWQIPEVKVLTPKEDEIYMIDSTLPITWDVTVADPSSGYYADVYLSLDGGNTYELLASNLFNATSYDWDIPDDSDYASHEAVVKVHIEDTHNLENSDESDEFIIATEDEMIEVDVTHPKGGMKHKLGQQVLIKWATTLLDPNSDFDSDIYFSTDEGHTFEKIANDLTNEKQYHWTIPDDSKYITDEAIFEVVVEDDHGNSDSDRSGVFEISDNPSTKTLTVESSSLKLPEVKESSDEEN